MMGAPNPKRMWLAELLGWWAIRLAVVSWSVDATTASAAICWSDATIQRTRRASYVQWSAVNIPQQQHTVSGIRYWLLYLCLNSIFRLQGMQSGQMIQQQRFVRPANVQQQPGQVREPHLINQFPSWRSRSFRNIWKLLQLLNLSKP